MSTLIVSYLSGRSFRASRSEAGVPARAGQRASAWQGLWAAFQNVCRVCSSASPKGVSPGFLNIMPWQSTTIRVQREPETEDLPLPSYATPGSSGVDLLAAVGTETVLHPGERKLISTGIRVAIPAGLEGQLRPRSGLATRHGISIVNSPGTIDSDYRGVIQVILINHGNEPFTIRRGDRIAQLVISPVTRAEFPEVASLPETARSDGGFGHTGVRSEPSSPKR